MKKIFATLFTMVLFASNISFAAVDIPDNYWAVIEVNDMIKNDINYPNNVVNMLNTSMGITQIYTGISGLLISSLILKLKK